MSQFTNNLSYIFTSKNFAALLDKYEYRFNKGDIVAGTIFSIESKFVLVDIGANTVGFLPKEEISRNRISDISQYLKLNEVREFSILLFDQETNQIILSIKKVELMTAWRRLEQVYSENIILQTQIIRSNRGGYIVELEGVKGFIPNSHLILMQKKEDILKSCVAVKILELNESQNYLLLSLRCAYIQQNRHLFRLGKIVKGVVQSIQSYGLFVNVEQLQGLLHSSEIVKQSNQSLKELFAPGQDILVMIIHVDHQKGRIAFSQRGFPRDYLL